MRSILTRLRRNESGNVLLMTGLSFFVLLGVSGMALDLGRQQLVRVKLQNAADAAALAGAVALEGQDRSAVARDYFNRNFPDEFMGVPRPANPTIVVSDTITVSATADMDTYLVQFIGHDQLTATGRSVVGIDEGPPKKYDIVLSLDVTGSMNKTDVGATHSGVPSGLADQVFATFRADCEKYFGDMGYPASTGDHLPADICSQAYYNKTILSIVDGPTRLNALRNASYALIDKFLADDAGNNRIAGVAWAETPLKVLDFSNNYAEVKDFVDRLYAFQATNSVVGLQGAQNLMAAARDDAVKVVVVITDGVNTLAGTKKHTVAGEDGNPDEYGCTGKDGTSCPKSNELSAPICTALKQQDIQVFTVAFGIDVESNAVVHQFLSDCATQSPEGENLGKYFFIAPDDETLRAALGEIARTVKKIRINQ